MPFYEYACDACSHQFEVFHGMNETPQIRCDRCQGETRKVLFAPSVVFKGSGFYATEYGKSTHNNPKKPTSPSGTDSKETPAAKPAETASSTTSTETKPERKSDASPAPAPSGDGKKAA